MIKNIKKIMTRNTSVVSALLFALSFDVLAALPKPVAPSTTPDAGNWLDLIKGYVKDSGLVLGLTIAVVAFLWIAWITISKFNEARAGRAEWGEVGLTAVMAAGVMIFISFLLTEASNVI
ncbi:MAG: TIGR03745 family integrating conjugative element membrane protein [Methylococcaceae bacterium]